jgi:hypothetical protein
MASRNAEETDTAEPAGSPGIGVDARGGGVIDPTKNVLDLVRAESKYQDFARDSLKELMIATVSGLREQLKTLADGIVQYQDGQRDSETRRIDQLAQTRQEFQNTIRDMLAESVRTTSTLVSTQLVQIQATFDTRVSKLEAGAFTQAGKQSVADPALSDALARMAATLAALQASGSRMGGHEEGKQDTTARLWAVILGLAAIASPVIAVLALRGH